MPILSRRVFISGWVLWDTDGKQPCAFIAGETTTPAMASEIPCANLERQEPQACPFGAIGAELRRQTLSSTASRPLGTPPASCQKDEGN